MAGYSRAASPGPVSKDGIPQRPAYSRISSPAMNNTTNPFKKVSKIPLLNPSSKSARESGSGSPALLSPGPHDETFAPSNGSEKTTTQLHTRSSASMLPFKKVRRRSLYIESHVLIYTCRTCSRRARKSLGWCNSTKTNLFQARRRTV